MSVGGEKGQTVEFETWPGPEDEPWYWKGMATWQRRSYRSLYLYNRRDSKPVGHILSCSSSEEEASRTFTVTHPRGLHFRPAARILIGLKRESLEAAILIRCEDREVTLTSGRGEFFPHFSLLSLGAVPGDELVVRAFGPDAKRALDIVCEVLEAPTVTLGKVFEEARCAAKDLHK